MQPVRFIHAADLHLDTTFSGISREAPPELVHVLRQATFTALDRLVALCERTHPDFLALSGDLCNEEDGSLRARLALRDACARLGAQGIPVCIIHGNHDPFSSELRALPWPAGTIVFGPEMSSLPLYREGEDQPFVVIHGVSHATTRESRNLAALFQRSPALCPQVGLLHATLGGAEGAVYAPFSLEDLSAAGMDYWALGHIHDRRVVCRQPLAVYPGCTQGLHINETGFKGCLSVTIASDDQGGWQAQTQFHPLGPVRWETLDILLTEEEEDLDSLEARLRQTLDAAAGDEQQLIARLRLTGRTPLNEQLRAEETGATLLRRIRDYDPQLWVKDIEIQTHPVLDRSVILEQKDLLGEIFRISDDLQQHGLDSLRADVLAPLYEHARARKILDQLDDATLVRLLDDAENLCALLLQEKN